MLYYIKRKYLIQLKNIKALTGALSTDHEHELWNSGFATVQMFDLEQLT